eukprot:scaffold6767_cov108-Skeletonema_marinoi.AAC.6
MEQGMFGKGSWDERFSYAVDIWYVVKEVDGRKKARCVCDGSTRAGQVVVLDHTYANRPDQTWLSHILCYRCAAENHVVYGADATNAFGEAGAPKQGFNLS